MGDVVRMGKAIALAIDDEFDSALRPPLDRLAAVQPGLAKTELAEQLGERGSLGLVDGEFDEAYAMSARLRRQRTVRVVGPRGGQLVLQQQKRAHAVDRGPR